MNDYSWRRKKMITRRDVSKHIVGLGALGVVGDKAFGNSSKPFGPRSDGTLIYADVPYKTFHDLVGNYNLAISKKTARSWPYVGGPNSYPAGGSDSFIVGIGYAFMFQNFKGSWMVDPQQGFVDHFGKAHTELGPYDCPNYNSGILFGCCTGSFGKRWAPVGPLPDNNNPSIRDRHPILAAGYPKRVAFYNPDSSKFELKIFFYANDAAGSGSRGDNDGQIEFEIVSWKIGEKP
jgi:hypothetical protein